MADTAVESANIVGYSEQTGTDGSLYRLAPDFNAMGDAIHTAGDIASDDPEVGGLIRLYNAKGNTSLKLMYINAEIAEEADIEAGWYTEDQVADDDFSEGTQNATEIPLGSGFVYVPNGSSISFKGEVKQSATLISGNDGSLYSTGNCSPVDITMGDIVSDDPEVGGLVRFYNAKGNTSLKLMYINAEIAEEADIEVGWYTEDQVADDDFSEGTQNAKPLAAGEGFVYVPNGSSIAIPNPLPSVK